MDFKNIFESEDNKELALKWLTNKFGDRYKFKYNPLLNDIQKTFSASIEDKEFTIQAKKYDTNGDGEPDTVQFKIIVDEDEDPEAQEPEEEF